MCDCTHFAFALNFFQSDEYNYCGHHPERASYDFAVSKLVYVSVLYFVILVALCCVLGSIVDSCLGVWYLLVVSLHTGHLCLGQPQEGDECGTAYGTLLT